MALCPWGPIHALSLAFWVKAPFRYFARFSPVGPFWAFLGHLAPLAPSGPLWGTWPHLPLLGFLWGHLSGTQAYRLNWPLNSSSLGPPAQNWQNFIWLLISTAPYVHSELRPHWAHMWLRLQRCLTGFNYLKRSSI